MCADNAHAMSTPIRSSVLQKVLTRVSSQLRDHLQSELPDSVEPEQLRAAVDQFESIHRSISPAERQVLDRVLSAQEAESIYNLDISPLLPPTPPRAQTPPPAETSPLVDRYNDRFDSAPPPYLGHPGITTSEALKLGAAGAVLTSASPAAGFLTGSMVFGTAMLAHAFNPYLWLTAPVTIPLSLAGACATGVAVSTATGAAGLTAMNEAYSAYKDASTRSTS
jgi:hypothetical protein